jgi:hypothetical protein
MWACGPVKIRRISIVATGVSIYHIPVKFAAVALTEAVCPLFHVAS